MRAALIAIFQELVRFAHFLDLVYIKELDAPPGPWEREHPAPAPAQPAQPAQQVQGVSTHLYGGQAAPGKPQQTITIKEQPTEEDLENNTAAWDYERFDGSQSTPDYTPWDITDEEAVAGMTEHNRNMYLLVRPDVIQGKKNREIAEKHGFTDRWADTHAGAVRAAFRERMRRGKTPSPSASREEEE